MDTSSLKEAGLTEGEIKVYLALLELGSSTTGPIVDSSGISRSIIYQILEKLMDKGLVSMITRAKTKHFQAAAPEKILQFIDKRSEDLKKNRTQVEQILPELLLKQKMVKQSEANFYSGYKGIRTAHEHTYKKLKRGEEYCYLGIPAFQPEEQHLYWKRDHERRKKSGINCRLLFNKDTDKNTLTNRNSYKGCDARWMPIDIITPAAFLIFKDTTIIITQHPMAMAVEIINQEVTDSFKAYFEEFWKKTSSFN